MRWFKFKLFLFWVNHLFKRCKCLLFGHGKETIWKKQDDQRYLIWVCTRCETVTRSMKMKQKDMRFFRKVKAYVDRQKRIQGK